MPKAMRVKTRFEATENIGKTARKIEQNTRKMNRSIQRGFRKSTKSALQFKSVLKGILAAGAISKGFGLLSRGVAEVATQFVSFDDSITAAAVRFKDIGPDAENFEEQLNKIKGAAREAGATTVFTATQSAKALDFLARAGFTSAEGMGSLRSMINLSIATGEDFAAVSDMSSDLLGAFGLNSENTAKKIANLNRLNDVLVKTTNSANVKVEDLFETMKQVGPVATGILGTGLEEVSSLAAILGNSGIKSSAAMTALKNIFLRLAAPANAGKKTLEALGLTLDDGTGKAKGMTRFMEEMGEKLKGFGPIKQAKIMDAVFGKRAIAGAKIIFNNIGAVDKFRATLDKAGGTSQRTADVMQKSLGNRIKGLGSALTELGFKVLDPFEKQIKNSITAMTEFFRGLDPTPMISSIKMVASAFGVVFDSITKAITATKEFFGVEEKPAKTAADQRKALDVIGKKQADLTGAELVAVGKKISEFTNARVLPPQAQRPGRKFDSTPGNPFAQLTTFDTRGAGRPELFRQTLKTMDEKISSLLTESFKGGNFEKNVKQLQAFTRPFLGEPQFQPAPQPNLSVNVENQINAKDVEVDTKVKAPGTSGNLGANRF